ncbi:MAG: hypothetical protein KDA61_06120, partial [Planctomycetales bacterium]|nr:hypothetical protein [Planctomycetales bacterium]
YCLARTPRGVEVFRTSDGEIVSRLEAPGVQGSGVLAFNDRGDQAAWLSEGRIVWWEIESGSRLADFYLASLQGGDLAFVGKGLALVGGDLVDLQNRLVLWRYEQASRHGRYRAGYFWNVVRAGQVEGLVPVALPHAEALQRRGDITQPAALAVEHGTRIAVDNQVHDDNREKFASALQSAVESAELQEASDASLRLIARLGEVKTEQQSYRRFGESLFSEGTQVTVETGRTYQIALESNGKTYWQTQLSSSGLTRMHVRMKEGESIGEAVQRETNERSSGRQYGFAMPPFIVEPSEAGPLGVSKLTLSGIE